MTVADQIVDYVRAHPGATSTEVAKAVGPTAAAYCATLAVRSRPRLVRWRTDLPEAGRLRWIWRYWAV